MESVKRKLEMRNDRETGRKLMRGSKMGDDERIAHTHTEKD